MVLELLTRLASTPTTTPTTTTHNETNFNNSNDFTNAFNANNTNAGAGLDCKDHSMEEEPSNVSCVTFVLTMFTIFIIFWEGSLSNLYFSKPSVWTSSKYHKVFHIIKLFWLNFCLCISVRELGLGVYVCVCVCVFFVYVWACECVCMCVVCMCETWFMWSCDDWQFSCRWSIGWFQAAGNSWP